VKRRVRIALVLALCILSAPVLATSRPSARQEALPNPATIVKPRTYVSLEPVPAGKQFEVAVVVEIQRGFHMNSHKPSEEYLIPTTLTAELPAGVQLVDTVYPAGRPEKFAFAPDKALDVYTGTVTVKLMLSAHPGAKPGTVSLPITLRYQACNDSACLPPVKVPVSARFEIAAPGTKARAVHPEIFSPAAPKG
jgi:DsbC/DsbD-like thiol-disulfide interchange protein